MMKKGALDEIRSRLFKEKERGKNKRIGHVKGKGENNHSLLPISKQCSHMSFATSYASF